MAKRFAALAALAAMTVSCDNGASLREVRGGPAEPRATVTLKGIPYDVRLIFTEKDRRSAPGNLPRVRGAQGYLLGWPGARRIRLSPEHARASFTAAFLDRGGKVVDLQLFAEGNLDAVRSKADAAFALLLSPGLMNARPFAVGDAADFSPEVKAATPDPMPSLTLGERKYEVLTFFTERDRQHAAEHLETPPSGEAYLMGWGRARAIKLESEYAPASFTVAFLDRSGKIVDLKPFVRGDREGLQPATDAAYALFLPESTLRAGTLRSGDSAEFSPQLKSAPPEELPVVKVGGHTAYVELALTEAERQQGLMFRPRLSPQDGMLFAYDREGMRQFWMGNTLLPLDIAFFREDGTLVNVNETPKYPDPRNPPRPYPTSDSAGPVRFVLETNLGWFRKRGLIDAEGKVKPGTKGEFPPEAFKGR